MDLQGWIDKYEEKTGEKFIRMEGYELLFFPDKGFCELSIDDDSKTIFLHRICGDFKTWWTIVESIRQLFGYHRIRTIVIRRNIKAFIRLFGADIVAEHDTENGESYECNYDVGKAYCFPYDEVYVVIFVE